MGLDGGTAVTSGRMLAAAAAQRDTRANDDGGVHSANQVAQLEHTRRWHHCALSGLPLAMPPIVADRLGNLMLKVAALELVLARRSGGVPETPAVAAALVSGHFAHIRSMNRDVVELKLAAAPPRAQPQDRGGVGGGGDEAAVTAPARNEAEIARFFACGVFGLPPPASVTAPPFFVRWRCGHVLSQAAVREAAAADRAEAAAATRVAAATSGGSATPHSASADSLTTLCHCPVAGCADRSPEPTPVIMLVPPSPSTSEEQIGQRRARS
jgi:hypothetical protein